MNTWPLDRIPHLNMEAFLALLQSVTREQIGSHSPMRPLARPVKNFAELSWDELGCTDEDRTSIAEQFATLFRVPVPSPAPDEQAGRTAERTFAIWEQGPRLMTFLTSGSTGVPKPCIHQEEHLRQELVGVAPLVEDRASFLVTVPLHHMYGFTFGLLLPLALGAPVRSEPPLPTVVAAKMRPGDLVVGIPLLWTRFVQSKAINGTGVTLFTATSPTPPDVLRTLRGMGFRTLELFGASETGVMAWRESPDDPFCLLPHLRRSVTPETGKELERALPDGRLQYYPLLDDIEWTDDRHMRPQGRKDNAVQVAGINVFPHRVAEALQTQPGVRACYVRLMGRNEGERLKAFVVPDPGVEHAELRRTLVDFARSAFSEEERPGHYTFGEDVPRSPLGKPTDWPLLRPRQ